MIIVALSFFLIWNTSFFEDRKTFAVMFTASVAKFIFSFVANTLSLFKNIVEGYRQGDVTLQSFYEFNKLKIREMIIHYTGLYKITSQGGIFEIEYTTSHKTYKIRFPKYARNYISYVLDNNEKRITADFLCYLGPGNNFYSIPTTPKMLGWNEGITVGYFINGEMKQIHYSPDDIILYKCSDIL